MVTKRLEMRIDEERLARLERVAKEEGESISEIARRFMDRGYDDWMKWQRKEAVRRMAEANLEDVPDPEELSRQLDSTHDIPDPYRR